MWDDEGSRISLMRHAARFFASLRMTRQRHAFPSARRDPWATFCRRYAACIRALGSVAWFAQPM